MMKIEASVIRGFGMLVAAALLASCNKGSPAGLGSPGPVPPGTFYVFNGGASGGSIEAFSTAADGNTAPLATIAGAYTQLSSPLFGTVDANGNLYAPNASAYTVTTYAAGSSGNAAPSTIISGYSTGLGYPSGIAVDGSGTIYVANPQHQSQYTSITEYPAGANGNQSPSATIKGSNTKLDYCYTVALDTKGYIYVANSSGGSGGGWITVYAPGSNGNVSPVRLIQGSNTGLQLPTGIALDAAGNLYVGNSANNSITVYASGANGNVAPARRIIGTGTGLNKVNGVAVDSAGNIFAANEGTPSITVYGAGAAGDATPLRTITGSATGLNNPVGLAVF